MTDTATTTTMPSPAPRPWAVVNFPTDVDMSEYADAESLTAQGADDAALASLGTLTQLVTLSIDGTFTDEGLTHLAGLERLEQLTITSPEVTGRGLRALKDAGGLQALTLRRLGEPTPKAFRSSLKRFPQLTRLVIEGRLLGLEHLLMLPALAQLESLRFVGGGDILGSGEGQLDRVSATELAGRYPALRDFTARWWNGSSMVSDPTLVAMLQARPGSTVNGTWYDAKVFAAGGDSQAAAAPSDAPAAASAGVIDLTSETFAATAGHAPLALVQIWTSQDNYCKAVTVGVNAIGAGLEQLANALGGSVVVGRVDAFAASALGTELKERYSIDVGALAVFRHGELVGKLSASSGSSILAQLQPVL